MYFSRKKGIFRRFERVGVFKAVGGSPMRAVGVVRWRQRGRVGATITPNSAAKIGTKNNTAQHLNCVLTKLFCVMEI